MLAIGVFEIRQRCFSLSSLRDLKLISQCHRQIDGKPPGKCYPCDFCTSVQGICSTAVASKVKPDAWQVVEDTNWKTYYFKEIISEHVEEENLSLRKSLGGFEERINNLQTLHEVVKSELAEVKKTNSIITSALDTANQLVKSRTAEKDSYKKLLREMYRKYDDLKGVADSGEPSVSPLEETAHGNPSLY